MGWEEAVLPMKLLLPMGSSRRQADPSLLYLASRADDEAMEEVLTVRAFLAEWHGPALHFEYWPQVHDCSRSGSKL
jgi:hypothetical protein